MTDEIKKHDKKDELKVDAEKLQKDLAEAKAKCEEYLNGWKRERADFLNYKKDEMERIGELAKYVNTEIILKIIPILDNIYLAESHMPESLRKARHSGNAGLSPEANWVEGFLQIKNQLYDFLAKEGISPIDSLGKQFDPNTMESIGEISNSQFPIPNTVVEETQKGYTMHGRIIRVAKVRIAK